MASIMHVFLFNHDLFWMLELFLQLSADQAWTMGSTS